MELRTLNYFLTVAREENITRAAALLHLTQPTLSRQLMQLEEELGVKLFRRSQHRIVLTEEGMLLRRRAQEIVELTEKTARELRPQEELAGRISIGSGDLQSMTLLARILTGFQREHPRIEYEIYSGNSDGIKESMEQCLLDMGLLLEPVDLSRYEILRLPVRESWSVLVPEDSPLAQKEVVTPRDLADGPLILTTRELMRQEMVRWLGPYADRIRTAASGNLPYNLTQLAREGMGAYLNIKLNCTYDGLKFIPLSPPLESGTVLAWKKSQAVSPAISGLLQFTQQYISRMERDNREK